MPAYHVDHGVLARHAQDKVNVPADDAEKRRAQVNRLRASLERHIAAHPGYDLVKLRASGSTAKHTAIRRRRGEGSDADIAVYVRAASVGGVDADECDLLDWLCDRCREVYGATKEAEDFVISEHAVGITMRGSGLKIDVAPVLYEGADDDYGHLITRQGDRVLGPLPRPRGLILRRREEHMQHPCRGQPAELRTGSALDRRHPMVSSDHAEPGCKHRNGEQSSLTPKFTELQPAGAQQRS